ncbi:hypothetical protein LA080_006202 [Diaporthe eres]|nr:hypothetical protein LA080_006202 [Diaporthe eres]
MKRPNHSHDGSVSPLSTLASTPYYNRDSGERREAAPAYTSIDSQQQRLHYVHRQEDEFPFESKNRVHRLWLWKILSITVAGLVLMAIVTILVLHKSRPLPKWPSAITINTLIAVSTAVFKACLIMPIAEGIGQLKWLWYQKWRPLRHMEQWDLASRVIGAILTILAMAVDPFTQQVVQFYSCSTVVEGERATVPFSNNYTAGYWFYGGDSQLDPQMQSAMYIGLLDPLANTSAGESQDTHAFECEFYPAVNTYSANINNGVLLEQVLDSQPMDVWTRKSSGTQALLIVNRTIRGGKWHECTGSPNPSDENNIPLIMYPSDFDYGPQISTEAPSSSFYNYNITWWPQDCIYWLPSEIAGTKGDPWSVKLWNNGTPTLDTVQATMDGMTRSVTARLRQGDGISANIGPANGTVWGTQTCVGVNWEWLALPAGLLLLTIVFLVLTITRTSSKQAWVWKSSIFAVLFSGLDHETRKSDEPVVSLEEMKAAADRATVRLEDTREGFRLVGQV